MNILHLTIAETLQTSYGVKGCCLAEIHDHELINYIDNKAKCRHLKKFTCKGTVRQVFIGVYRLKNLQSIKLYSADTVSHVGILTQLCELLPL